MASEPAWVRHALWWHLYPLGFVGAEREAPGGTGIVHRLGHIKAWLDYVVELGASGLALGPIFASSSHGYDTVDHFRIDSRLGDDADFDDLLAAAHDRGVRVILDGVFNHVGRAFPAFQEVLREGAAAAHASWFRLARPAGTEPHYQTFEGHDRLVVLNHDDPAVGDYVVRVMDYWLDRGADGWRLDAAHAVPRRFWAEVLPRVRTGHPEAYFVGEVFHGDYSAFVRETGMDAITQYELWKAIWSALNDRNFFELAWALERHNGFLATFKPMTFVGNHDVTRLASQLADERHLPHALVVLFTVGGTPSVYSGDEQAFRGIKEERPGGDDAIRPAFPETPAGLCAAGWPIFRLHQQLIGLRHRHAWLHAARVSPLHLSNQCLVYESSHADHRLLVALNLGDGAVSQTVPRASAIAAGLGALQAAGQATARIDLPAHGWAILEVEP
ncbi:alpha-amylase family protein [Telmatospirillum sp.]|uniref:alpha-amylase family protein n=1 Tax=Telmatospirillum sp. TaxID=2079197 RepID=UPI00283BC747|nr:alpha-amylase family protein [Telmatospirillum sp.]MDR3435733.1 alpha-amylase family protein [Telmatospirillum sp.]